MFRSIQSTWRYDRICSRSSIVGCALACEKESQWLETLQWFPPSSQWWWWRWSYFARRSPTCRIFAGRAISTAWRGGRARRTWTCSVPVADCSSCWWASGRADRCRRRLLQCRVSRWRENGDLSFVRKEKHKNWIPILFRVPAKQQQ